MGKIDLPSSITTIMISHLLSMKISLFYSQYVSKCFSLVSRLLGLPKVMIRKAGGICDGCVNCEDSIHHQIWVPNPYHLKNLSSLS